eukprot:613198-Prymnesium_polylepis.1
MPGTAGNPRTRKSPPAGRRGKRERTPEMRICEPPSALACNPRTGRSPQRRPPAGPCSPPRRVTPPTTWPRGTHRGPPS